MIDIEEATRLLQKVEEMDSWFIPGLSDSFPVEERQALLKKAAELGCEDAFNKIFFTTEEQKVDFLKTLALQNIPYACYHYSQYFRLYESKDLYVYWLKRAASLGFSEAEYEIGTMYLWGNIVNQNFFTGLSYLNKASENNNVNALVFLSILYEKGCFGNVDNLEIIPKDPQLAFSFRERAANLGDRDSIFWLSNSYYEGNFVSCDVVKSNKLLERLPETDQEAAAILALRYEKGIGYAKDIPKAISYYKIALSDQYCPNANILKHVARLYESIDEIDSAQSYYESALSDLQPEMHGDILYEYLLFLGKYKRSDENVKKYLEKCADQAKNNYDCTYCMGMCYSSGIGVIQDMDRAKYYLGECNKWAHLATYKSDKFPIIVNKQWQ